MNRTHATLLGAVLLQLIAASTLLTGCTQNTIDLKSEEACSGLKDEKQKVCSEIVSRRSDLMARGRYTAAERERWARDVREDTLKLKAALSNYERAPLWLCKVDTRLNPGFIKCVDLRMMLAASRADSITNIFRDLNTIAKLTNLKKDVWAKCDSGAWVDFDTSTLEIGSTSGTVAYQFNKSLMKACAAAVNPGSIGSAGGAPGGPGSFTGLTGIDTNGRDCARGIPTNISSGASWKKFTDEAMKQADKMGTQCSQGLLAGLIEGETGTGPDDTVSPGTDGGTAGGGSDNGATIIVPDPCPAGPPCTEKVCSPDGCHTRYSTGGGDAASKNIPNKPRPGWNTTLTPSQPPKKTVQAPNGNWAEYEWNGNRWSFKDRGSIPPLVKIPPKECIDEYCQSCERFMDMYPKLRDSCAQPYNSKAADLCKQFGKTNQCCKSKSTGADPRVVTPLPDGEMACYGSPSDVTEESCKKKCSVASDNSCMSACKSAFKRTPFAFDMLDKLCERAISEACFSSGGIAMPQYGPVSGRQGALGGTVPAPKPDPNPRGSEFLF